MCSGRGAPALGPDRKSSEGRQRLQSRLNVPQIDFGLEKRDLVIAFGHPLLDHLVGPRYEHLPEGEAKRLGGL
jgi:hypothetical protein